MRIPDNRSFPLIKLVAVKQAVYKIIMTERYQYIMYSWNYGVELLDLFGEPVTYVCPELKRSNPSVYPRTLDSSIRIL